MERARWQQLVAQEADGRLRTRTLACFNANVDVVAHLDPQALEKFVVAVTEAHGSLPEGDPNATSVQSVQQFLAVLKESLKRGKSTYLVLEDLSVLDWLDKYIVNAERAIGGQAGIIANQMAALGARSTVYTPNLGTAQTSLLHENVLAPRIHNKKLEIVEATQAVDENAVVKVNWIFEYGADISFAFENEVVTTPRANRVILATRPSELAMEFDETMSEYIPDLASYVDVAFMAGYHYVTKEEVTSYMERVTKQLDAMRAGNNELRMHFEYVPCKQTEVEKTLLSTISRHVDSFGINEHEIVRALTLNGLDEEGDAIKVDENAYTLYRGVYALQKKLGVPRIQLHNLGYYVIVLAKPYYTSPQIVRNASLFGSTVNAAKAKYGGVVSNEQVRSMQEFPLSDRGLAQVELFAKHKDALNTLRFVEDGIWEADDHWALIVPAHVYPDPVSTVGMGDTISSSSFAREVEQALLVSSGVN